MSKIKVAEKFYSIQGEGRFTGVPSVFLRTFGCNFTCPGFGMPAGQASTEADEVAQNIQLYSKLEDLPLVKTGCDSYASWHPKFKHLSPTVEVPDLAQQLVGLTPNRTWTGKNGNDIHLVITGGEPLLGWQREYPELLDHSAMADLQNITFETNGTQELSDKFANYLSVWPGFKSFVYPNKEVTFSVSPKLSASGEKWSDAIKPDVIAQYQEVGTVYLKFVVSTPEHVAEVRQAVAEYRAAGFTGKVYLMPVGGVNEVYDANQFSVAQAALAEGWYFSPRLHLSLFGNAWAT